MSITANQARTLRQHLTALRPHWRSDRALPERIERLLKQDRRLGSRDRRLHRELLYAVLRYLPWIEAVLESDSEAEARIAWLAPESPATSAFRADLAAGWPICPDSVAEKAAYLGEDADAVLPAWMRSECPEAFAPRERDALCARAPLWIRLQTANPAAVFAEFDALGWPWRRSPDLPDAVRLEGNPKIAASEAFQRGRIEIQDVGSQAILAEAFKVERVAPDAPGQPLPHSQPQSLPNASSATRSTPGSSFGHEFDGKGARWLDACAGAGGKTLQLAWLLGAQGHVDAWDIRASALAELRERAARQEKGSVHAPASIATPRTLAQVYDSVLVDAPCSGSGTWRRQPHLKWTMRPAEIAAYAARQLALLAQFATRVRPGGRLIYATCSLCRSENEAVAERFLASHPGFKAEAEAPGGIRYWPSTRDGDGFYAIFLQNAASARDLSHDLKTD